MRIGIYSGSFDPIHTNHAMVANYCAQWGGVDEVWLMVSRLNPLKEGSHPIEDLHRLHMVKLVAEMCRNVKASDFELGLPQPSYTYVTLCRLREQYPEHEFVLIVGSDNWPISADGATHIRLSAISDSLYIRVPVTKYPKNHLRGWKCFPMAGPQGSPLLS